MNNEDKEDLKDFFKNTKEIKGYMGVPTDFKDIFKNVPEINELPPVPENLDTTHLQEFIDEIEFNEEKIAEYETLYSKKYNETEEFGRTQFVAMIVDLQQENRQLKKVINNFHYCPYDDKCGELYDCSKEEYQGMIEGNMKLSLQLDLYKSVLDEIRNVIENKIKELENSIEEFDYDKTIKTYCKGKMTTLKHLLQILDKAKGE